MIASNPYIHIPPATSTESIYFDGVNETAGAGSVSMMQGASAFTYMLWVRPDTVSGTDRLYYQLFNGNRYMEITMVNAKLRVIIRNVGVSPSYGNILTDNNVFSSTTWAHVAITFSSGTVVIYIDGSSVPFTDSGTTPASTATNNVNTEIVSANYFEGYLDEVALFDYALSGAQVTEAYNDGITNDYNLLSGGAPEHYWKFETADGDDETTVNDQGDTGTNDLTLTNMEIGDYQNEVP